MSSLEPLLFPYSICNFYYFYDSMMVSTETNVLIARFVKHPEYLREGQKLVFREGRTKAVIFFNCFAPRSYLTLFIRLLLSPKFTGIVCAFPIWNVLLVLLLLFAASYFGSLILFLSFSPISTIFLLLSLFPKFSLSPLPPFFNQWFPIHYAPYLI